MAYLHKVKAHGNLVFAALVLGTGLHFSCTSDIESAEDILGQSSSSLGSSGFSSSSSSSLPGGFVFCMSAVGCAEMSAEACSAFGGTNVASCPAGSSSSLAGVSSSSSPFGVLSSSSIPISSSSSGGNSGGGSVAYEGQTYRTVRIGTQTWFAENLNYAVAGSKCYGEGGEVVIGDDENDNPITKILSPAEVQANCVKYGRLYDWNTALKVCPAGWHLPNRDEWQKIVDFAGGRGTAGKLKAKEGWAMNGNGTDDHEFSALPGGYGGSDGSFYGVGSYGHWWSAVEGESSSTNAYSRDMDYGNVTAYWYGNGKTILYSVRCLQD